MKALMKYIFLPIFLIFLFNFLEYGSTWDRVDQFIYPIIMAMICLVNFFKPKFRKLFLIVSLTLLCLMILVYLLNEVTLANTVGSFGFAILLIVVISLLPQLIKKGYIEKI